MQRLNVSPPKKNKKTTTIIIVLCQEIRQERTILISCSTRLFNYYIQVINLLFNKESSFCYHATITKAFIVMMIECIGENIIKV